MLWYFAFCAEITISTVHRTAERASRRDFRICDLLHGDRVKQVTWVGSFDGNPSFHHARINRRTVSRTNSDMKPTVYFPLVDLRPTGVSRTDARSIAHCSAGRIASRRLWVEAEGRQVGMNVHANETAGGSGQKRTS